MYRMSREVAKFFERFFWYKRSYNLCLKSFTHLPSVEENQNKSHKLKMVSIFNSNYNSKQVDHSEFCEELLSAQIFGSYYSKFNVVYFFCISCKHTHHDRFVSKIILIQFVITSSIQKFFVFFALALIAAASADVSHLRQYLPPDQPGQAAAASAPSNQYIPPAAPQASNQHSQQAEPAAASFNDQTGYEYQHP